MGFASPRRGWGSRRRRTPAPTTEGGSLFPPAPTAQEASALELGVKFKADANGQITALRFYKIAGSPGPHVGHLWNAGGQLLATATYQNETVSGWQQVNLTTPISIVAGQVYV